MTNLDEMTDEELALAYMGGDNKAFDLLLSRNEVKLFSYIMFEVQDRNLADDIFQETFIRAVTRLQSGHYSPTGKFYAWLMRIAHNVVMDKHRSPKGRKMVDLGENNDFSVLKGESLLADSLEKELVKRQVLRDVRKLMGFLPEVQRDVLYMRYYKNMSFKEISHRMNVSINTSLGRMRYALINLRRMARENDIYLDLG